MCPHLHAVLIGYRDAFRLPEKGRYVICRTHQQMIIHGDGIWIWSNDPSHIEDCYAGR